MSSAKRKTMFGLFGSLSEGSSQPNQKSEVMHTKIMIRFIEKLFNEFIFLEDQIKIFCTKFCFDFSYRGEASEKSFILLFLFWL